MNTIKPMDAAVQSELDVCISSIAAMDGVQRIYLFGSYAYGKPTDNSDIDLMVVVNDNVKEQKMMFQISRKLSYDRAVPVDFLVNRECVFKERSAPDRVTLQREIKDKGILLYDKC